GQQLGSGGGRIAERLRRGKALDCVRLRRIGVEGFLDGKLRSFKKGKGHADFESGEIAEMEKMVASLHSFVGDASLIEHVAEFKVKARIFAAPERAERVLFRITGRHRRGGRSERMRPVRRDGRHEGHVAVGTHAEAVAVLSFALRANHPEQYRPARKASGSAAGSQ